MDEGRRIFLKVCAAVGGGLLFSAGESLGQPADPWRCRPGSATPFNGWLRIGTDGRLVILVDRAEMGQGVMTSLAMLVAEELDVDLSQVAVAFATGRPEYVNPMFSVQVTAASSSVRLGWLPLRSAGAAARATFVEAAARLWGVAPNTCRTARGEVLSGDGTRRLTYAELCPRVSGPPPGAIVLKRRRDFRLIGVPVPRLDSWAKVTGAAVFGIDVVTPGLRVAVIARPPIPGGNLSTFNAGAARTVPGVSAIVPIASGLAVVAGSFWQALKGRDTLQIEWTAPSRLPESGELEQDLRKAARQSKGRVVRSSGNYERARRSAARIVSAEYEVPYQAHAPMEPMNCTADVRSDGCTIWAPTQNPGGARLLAAKITGLPLTAVEVNVTYLGGSFGRRQELDFVAEAVEVSKRIGAPVKVIWTREDDMEHDFFRPAAVCRLEAAIDRNGKIAGWRHRIASTSIWRRVAPVYADLLYLRWLPHTLRQPVADMVTRFVPLGIDQNLAEGAAEVPYGVQNVLVDYVEQDTGVPVGAWRSVGHSYNVFAVESFIDEVSGALGIDPCELRRGLLAKTPRLRAVLKSAAGTVGWGQETPRGTFHGVAAYEYLGTYVAMVVEVLCTKGECPRISRIVCAIDCGIVVNPGIARAQVEGGIAFGLGATTKHKITFRAGRVVERNFDRYEPLRMTDMPSVEVHFVDSDAPPTGLGEAATPGVAPALCNALYAATGTRFRRLPVDLAGCCASG